ncbi:probable WRKY transcription factor 24 [Phalaenopsis equestris]|uniref:probable WRKY transcription factor 24 n=1 Tax=Phalaenopsis equestris TaxID=78828 RepID=UPI0009E485A4|nr:probable WRKY transcription factor 24 [Phalaenopsis equestris]
MTKTNSMYRKTSQEVKGGDDEQIPAIVIPKDEYEWNKYGQKLIKRIGNKYRSYFKCRKKDCGAKKKVEWAPSNPSNVRVLYEGVHNHQRYIIDSDPVDLAAMIHANQYDLVTQIFGTRN